MTKITMKYIKKKLKANSGGWIIKNYGIEIKDNYVSLINNTITGIAIERFKKCFPNAELVGIGKDKVTDSLFCDFIFY